MEEKKNKHEYHQEMHSLGCNKKDNRKKRVCVTYPFFLFPSALLPVPFAASIKFPKSSQNSVI